MSKYPKYLSDKQLSDLINEIEEHEMVDAPDDLAGQIMTMVQAKKTEKKRELMKYSIKVAFSAAASIAILFAVPMVNTTVSPQSAPEQQAMEKPISKALASLNQLTNGFFDQVNASTTNVVNQGGKRNEKEKEK